jgi:hypothetical protein
MTFIPLFKVYPVIFYWILYDVGSRRLCKLQQGFTELAATSDKIY